MSDGFFSGFSLRFKNAKKVISQIRAGEWVPIIHDHDRHCYTARRKGRMLWLANGPFFCDLKHPDSYEDLKAFGLIFRHWVWWAAAGKLKEETEEKMLAKHKIPRL